MRQKYELAGIIVEFGNDLVNNSNLNSFQVKVLSNIARCRTAALGGHEDQCDNCGKSRYSYNSCRDRHCPKCQAAKQAFRIEDLINTTLPIKHYHIVFTVPHILNKICLYNNRWFYDQLFASVWDTLRTFGYTHFGVGSGAVCMLHTWGRNLSLHTHIHCIVPAAGFSLDGKWKNIGGTGKFLYPVYQLSDTFQGKFIDSIKRRLRKENLLSEFDAVLQQAWNKKWVVNCEPSLAKAEHVVKYLGQYTHRVAITNQRILNIDKSGVTFIAKDYRDRALKKPVHMDGVEFLRRFCLHILPYRFVKIRRYGIYNPALKRNLKLQFVSNTEIGPLPAKKEKGKPKETVQERFLRLTGVDVYQCPFCKKGKMHVVKELPRVRSPDIFNISAQAVCSP
jgi:hypothetical protein